MSSLSSSLLVFENGQVPLVLPNYFVLAGSLCYCFKFIVLLFCTASHLGAVCVKSSWKDRVETE